MASKASSSKRNPSTSQEMPNNNVEGRQTQQERWKKGDLVLCRYRQDYYEAKIMDIKQNFGELAYAIHYPGWNRHYDELISHSEALQRFKDFTQQEADKGEVKRSQRSVSRKSKTAGKPFTSTKDESRPDGDEASDDEANLKVTSSTNASNRLDLQQLAIPEELRRILVDDNIMANEGFFLPKLPARITVYDIIQKYRESVSSGEDFVRSEFQERTALGLVDYFDTLIGSKLLYKFERPMFNELREKLEQEKAEEMDIEDKEQKVGSKRIHYSQHFGLPHLLRLLVRFAEMLVTAYYWEKESLLAIIRYVQEFVMFLNENHQEFFDVDEDYVLATSEYHRLIRDNELHALNMLTLNNE